MLQIRSIRKLFSKMILYKGKVSFDPNTLNNQIHTYFLANDWANQNLKGDMTCNYQNWIKLIEDTNHFSKDVSKATGNKVNAKLFNDWSVYGDGMALLQYMAIGQFDPSTDDSVKTYNPEEQYIITSKIGQHKSNICDMDTDAQFYSKWFGMELLNRKSNQILKFKPSSFRNISTRTLNRGGSAGYSADWFFLGTKQSYVLPRQNSPTISSKQLHSIATKESTPTITNKTVFLRSSQYRYTGNSKLSSTIGYLAQTQIESNGPNMQGWRNITFMQGRSSSGNLLFKNIPGKGLLLDFANAIWQNSDQNDTTKINYPSYYYLTLVYGDNFQHIGSWNVPIQQINTKQAGIHFIKGFYIQNRPVDAYILFKLDQQIDYRGTQKQYYICAADAYKKSNVTNAPFFQQQSLNQVDFDLTCTRFGVPLHNQTVSVQLDTSYMVSSGGLSYSDKKITDGLNQALKNEEFKQKYKDIQTINQKIFQGKLKNISSITDSLIAKLNFKNQWKIPGKGTNIFKLNFAQTNQNRQRVTFINGKANIKVCLNEPLTNNNNPRRPVATSLCVCGDLTIKTENNVAVSDTLPVSTIFYQTGEQYHHKSQWITDVGPILKTFGLIYPSMQKIVDLYNFHNVSMTAMKRAFDIEDELNPRYMPSTRELSKIEHRNIRKWLYEPIFNASMISYGTNRYRNFIRNYCTAGICEINTFLKALPQRKSEIKKQDLINYKINFKNEKKQFINDLRTAFLIQLTTIPLYLSAMFSVKPGSQAHKSIRSVMIDEMKHLFIVSNVLNAVYDSSLFLNDQNAAPYTNPNYIPKYPIKNKDLPQILQISGDDQLANFLTFDILPCTADQLLRFATIQLPGQLNYLNFVYKGNDPTRRDRTNKVNLHLSKLRNQSNSNANFKTIGQLYSTLIEKLWSLSDLQTFINTNSESKVSLFTGDPTKQFTYLGLTDMAEIYDLRTALNQFRLIVEEGEGANLFRLNNQQNQTSHFIKFLQIYTECSAKIQCSDSSSMNAIVTVTLTDNDDIKLVTNQKFISHWSQQRDKIIDEKVKQQFCNQRNDTNQYPDISARPSFINTYEKLMKQFDFIFNVGFKQFAKIHRTQNPNAQNTEQELRTQFQVVRRTKMENGIAKMRQMRLHADRIITPVRSSDPSLDQDLGGRPNFNINFDNKKTFDCGSSKK